MSQKKKPAKIPSWDYGEGWEECEKRWRDRIAKMRKDKSLPCKGNPLGEGKTLADYGKSKISELYT